MSEGPNIVRIAALIGDNTRAEVLTTLMSGQALTATELADIACVTKQTISSHLGKLVEGGLLQVEQQGRHRYFRLAGCDIANLLESMMGAVASPPTLHFGPTDAALRRARVCYDHLAGELGVQMFGAMLERGILVQEGGAPRLTDRGQQWFTEFGIDVERAAARKRKLCRACLDWSERRHHLAGALGAALLQRIEEKGWAHRAKSSRAMIFTERGEKSLSDLFGDRIINHSKAQRQPESP